MCIRDRPTRVHIREVGPRDGFQNEPDHIPTDEKIRLIDPLSGEIRLTLEGHEDLVMTCAFTADGKLLISGGKDASIRIWDAETGQMLHFLERRTGGESVTHVSPSPDGNYTAESYVDTVLTLADTLGVQRFVLAGIVDATRFTASASSDAASNASRRRFIGVVPA